MVVEHRLQHCQRGFPAIGLFGKFAAAGLLTWLGLGHGRRECYENLTAQQ